MNASASRSLVSDAASSSVESRKSMRASWERTAACCSSYVRSMGEVTSRPRADWRRGGETEGVAVLVIARHLVVVLQLVFVFTLVVLCATPVIIV